MKLRRSRRPARPPKPRPGEHIPGDLLLARDIQTPPGVLEQLVERYLPAASPDSRRPPALVLRALAKNPNTPPETLSMLSHDYPWEVAQNPAVAMLRIEVPFFLERLSSEAARAIEGRVSPEEEGPEADEGIPW